MDLVYRKQDLSKPNKYEQAPGASLSDENMKKMRFAHEYPTVLVTPVASETAKAS